MKDRKKHLLIMAGGTGGHIMPALAVAKEWQQRGYDVSWFGNEAGLEGRLVKEKQIPFIGLRYGFIDEKVKNFDPKAAEIQYKRFVNILSNKEALSAPQKL